MSKKELMEKIYAQDLRIATLEEKLKEVEVKLKPKQYQKLGKYTIVYSPREDFGRRLNQGIEIFEKGPELPIINLHYSSSTQLRHLTDIDGDKLLKLIEEHIKQHANKKIGSDGIIYYEKIEEFFQYPKY